MIEISFRSAAGVALLVVVVLTAGCSGILPGEDTASPSEDTTRPGTNTTDTPTDRERGAGDGVGVSPNFARISVGTLDYQPNGSEFIVEAGIDFELYGIDGETMDNVMICVYDQNGTVLYEKAASFTLPTDQTKISARLPETPAYLILDHPEFHTRDSVSRVFVKFSEGPDGTPERNNQFELSALPFEYPRHNETGRCM